MLTQAINTHATTAKQAATEIVEQLNNGVLIDNDRAILTDFDGQVAIAIDVAFDAAHGFLDGTGVYGYEGYGPIGPYLGEAPNVTFEAHDSVILLVYDS